MNGTPNADDALRIEPGTEPSDVRDFVERRSKRPRRFEDEGVTVWNYATHEVDEEALNAIVGRLQRDRYIIPYQVPGVWGYIQILLPTQISDSELLVYSQADERYKAYPNYRRVSDSYEDIDFRRRLERELGMR